MIIGLNGYAGVGKDCIGSIIQYLKCHKKGSLSIEELIADKTYIESWLTEKPFLEKQSSWEVKKWAGKLKTIASILTGIPESSFEDQEFKKTYMKPEWNYWTVSAIDNGKLMLQEGRFENKAEAEGYVGFMKQTYGEFRMKYVVGMRQMTIRQFLQELGTDACRKGLHSNVWVNALMADYKPTQEMNKAGFFVDASMPNWVITDTRFPNEAKAIKDKGGIVIRIDRPGCKPVNNHPSETSLDDWEFDYKILNGSDIVSLAFTVKNIMEKENLL